MDYETYIQSKEWRSKRDEYYASGIPYKCVVCDYKKGLHLHHKTYKNFGNENLEDLIWLCESCHMKFHGRDKQKNKKPKKKKKSKVSKGVGRARAENDRAVKKIMKRLRLF